VDGFADYDAGEMFHNFMMHPAERALAGVDVGCTKGPAGKVEVPGTDVVGKASVWMETLPVVCLKDAVTSQRDCEESPDDPTIALQ
jgi:hypothetical protein